MSCERKVECGSVAERYAIVIMTDERSRFIAVCPSFESCFGHGRSRTDALEMAILKLNREIEKRLDLGLALPPCSPDVCDCEMFGDVAERSPKSDRGLLMAGFALGNEGGDEFYF